MTEQSSNRQAASEALIQIVADIIPTIGKEWVTYSAVALAISDKRKAGQLEKVSPTFNACKDACEALVAQGRLEKQSKGKRSWYKLVGAPAQTT